MLQFLRRPALLVVAVLLAASGCGASRSSELRSSSRAAAPLATQEPTPSDAYTVQPQTTTENFSDTGLTISPPNNAAKLTASEAWASYRSRGSGFSGKGTTVMKLVTYTDHGRGSENKDGSVTPETVDRLAWVIEIPNVTKHINGSDFTYPEYVFIDASDGSLIQATQSSDFPQ